MKQTEINKLLNKVGKEVGKKYDWKSSGGFLFKRKGLLFFVLIILGQGKSNKIICSLAYKLFDFDEVFWNIVDLKDNINQPLSFHASGAWTVPTMQINDISLENNDWDEKVLIEKINNVIKEFDEISSNLTKKITTVDENLDYLEMLYINLLHKYPESVLNIYKEKLITAVLKKDYSLALKIAVERITQNDSGGFITGNKTFFTQAKEYLEKINKF